MFYRYERDGIGILQWLKVNNDNWAYYRDQVNYWLNGHPVYKPSYRSYFTQRGNDRFPKEIANFATNIIELEKLNNVVYADEWQVIVDTGESDG